jgi:hypothetical protein
MIKLIKNIKGEFISEVKGPLTLNKPIEASLKMDDYISIYGFTAYLQDFSRVPITRSVPKPNLFGYTPPIGITQKNIEINY